MITCGGGGAGVCFVVSRRTGEPWPGWKSGRLQCMGCIARKEMALSAFCCNCWDFATSLDALVSVTWVDLTFCIACSDCLHGAEKGSRGEAYTWHLYTLCFNSREPYEIGNSDAAARQAVTY